VVRGGEQAQTSPCLAAMLKRCSARRLACRRIAFSKKQRQHETGLTRYYVGAFIPVGWQ